ncbi:PaaI family thioesterase [Rhodococcus chondri]|uniref:PaaI family thioesterase n=1 Tax=Rhodococcus chondri TaxID=3065941 RepID=A0ABU7JKS5_9NOCA|nr:PaaI family thioesterase [Rhodococcus sp. CC-R104]MEE2030641.1 PaaI family thioesterase [Rhodococcus sp. CC-R104]
MTTEALSFPLDRPTRFTGIEVSVSGPESLSLRQAVGPRFHDHRGHTTIGSIGVLTDLAVGTPVGLARFNRTGVRQQAVIAQLTASTAHHLPTTGVVAGVGRGLHFDETAGLASAEIHDDEGNLVVHLIGRTIAVGRGAVELVSDDTHPGSAAEVAPEPSAEPGVLAELSGLDVVAGIAAGSVPRGPLAGMLGLEVRSVERGTVRADLTPSGWMANPLGSVQGGVLVSIADAVTGLAVQTLTDIGQQYRVLQLSVDYLRSPAVPGPVVHVQSDVVRAGRRLASLETVLTGPDGTVYVRAHANAQLLPAG